MRKSLREVAVICEEQQAFSLRVQTPDVEQPRKFCREQIKNSVACMGISPSRNESGGFMQYDGERRSDANKFAVYLNVITRARLRAEVGAGFTVDSDPPRGDQFIAMAARSNARSG